MSDQQITFQEHDKLNRKPFADFLFSLIQHRDEYRRPDSNKSYSIAIDAVYGSGKTRFLKMFQSMLRQEGQYNVAYYSAWEHDLYDDALAPILSLLDRPAGVFEDQAYERMEATLGSKALHVLKRMGTSFLSMKAKKHFGEDYEEIIDDIKDLFNGEASEPDAYDLRMKCIDELQKGLAKATEEAPLVFIIDELDRCNPAFAIKTLEVAKHLLDVENVVFIFALDMQQMRAAVRKFYGQDIDADGYLCKVFDYMTLLPSPNMCEYIEFSLQHIEKSIKHTHPQLFSFVSQILVNNHCTLRFIDTFISAFHILWVSFLVSIMDENVQIVYTFSLFLKYRYPHLFAALAAPTALSSDDKTMLRKLFTSEDHLYTLIEIASLDINNAEGSDYFRRHVRSYQAERQFFKSIRHLTYGQFIHRQLEMYNPIRTEDEIDSPSA